jgi:holo-[acyl-carrier protein] synthase
MIAGLGIDIIEVERVAEKISKENGFRELVFSENEISYCESRTNKFEHYAARFAAKEAFFKAIGTGWLKDTAFNEIEIIHNECGKPGISFLGATKATTDAMGITNLLVSLTHIKTAASAVVIIEK